MGWNNTCKGKLKPLLTPWIGKKFSFLERPVGPTNFFEFGIQAEKIMKETIDRVKKMKIDS